jgi:HK97 family phage portal protein
MSEEQRVLSDFVWTPERGEHDPEVRSISWNNLLLSDEVHGGKFLTAAEIRINPDTALQSTVFLACCRIISETVASLPLHVYRRLKNGHEEIAHDIPLYHVLSFAPNSWQTKFEFFEQMVMALTCWGNSYSEVNSGKYGAVTELNNLHPSRMRIERLENGRLKYSYNDPQTGRLMQYTQDQIMHVRWTPEPDGVKGMVPVEISRDAIALSRACEIYASKFWANMGRPGIVLQTDGALSAETAERLRDNWERIHRGVQNAYKTAVLTNGLKVEPFGATNNDSQFLEVRRFQCEEICRCFRLPLHLVQGQSGGNLEIQGQEFINYTLMPWLIRIEQSISRSLIYDDATYYAKFDTRGLLRGDSNSRAAFYSTMLNLGILSINECRRAEGLGPLGPEADKHLVAMNLQPLEEAVKPKPDPSMMPGFGSGAPPRAPGVPPSLPEVKTGKAPMESPKGEDSAKRAEVRELLPQDEKLEEAHTEIAEEEGKWTKESAHYIEKNPFSARGIKCHNCTHYVEEGGCKIVSGSIDGDAICKLWVIPPEKIADGPEQRAFCATGEGNGVDNSCGTKEGGAAVESPSSSGWKAASPDEDTASSFDWNAAPSLAGTDHAKYLSGYTNAGSRSVNEYFRYFEKHDFDDATRDYALSVDAAIEAVAAEANPSGEMKFSFRGIGVDDAVSGSKKYLKELIASKPGQLLKEAGIFSTSSKMEKALGFAGDGGVVVRVRGRSGAPLKSISRHDEHEVAYPNRSAFRVVANTRLKRFGTKTNVTLLDVEEV